MPRSSSSHSSSKPMVSSRYPVQSPLSSVKPFHSTTPPPVHLPSPTTGQLIKESIVSGVGSGIGFSAGTRMMNSIFGPTSLVGSSPPQAQQPPSLPSQTQASMQKCVEQMALHSSREDLPLCFHLLKEDMQYREFQQCMKTSENNMNLCRDFLPRE